MSGMLSALAAMLAPVAFGAVFALMFVAMAAILTFAKAAFDWLSGFWRKK